MRTISRSIPCLPESIGTRRNIWVPVEHKRKKTIFHLQERGTSDNGKMTMIERPWPAVAAAAGPAPAGTPPCCGYCSAGGTPQPGHTEANETRRNSQIRGTNTQIREAEAERTVTRQQRIGENESDDGMAHGKNKIENENTWIRNSVRFTLELVD